MSELKLHGNNGLLNMDEASQFLGIKKSTLYSLCMKRQISCVKIGRLNRFQVSSLNKWIESHIQEAV
ncbi:MAG: helix-turn-helix domain-containing protein [Planctomycetes bacterium]|uniref:helix-turn-helix domain-containing protein n=1 Tax=Candidatus Wunengus sp. YC65 TaxID=3367701 RepID=UPI001DAECB1D|nr:helix-turn-helix domain-containing protein [Planctomycetota bacterium]MBI5795641.1 helix-turn-helix domain-containing protein [Planctomycetota bacterium]